MEFYHMIKTLFLAAALMGPSLAYGAISVPLSVRVMPGSATCQLGNHGLGRGWAHVLNGTLVADDNCLLQMGFPASGLPSQGLSLAQFQDVYNNGHFNTIRYSIYLGCWYDDTCGGAGGGQTITDIENQLDAAVSYANQIGLYILVDNHNTLPDHTGSGYGCPDWSADTTIWTAIAPRYANNTNVIYRFKTSPTGAARTTTPPSRRTRILYTCSFDHMLPIRPSSSGRS
jgi:hypothetical protein